MSLNLEDQLVFYGKYHHTKGNIAIHMIGVPILITTFFLFGTNSPTLIPLPSYLTIPNLPLNFGTICAIIWSSCYVLLEPVAGSILSLLLLAATAFSKHYTTVAPVLANEIAISLHILSWIAQFYGHSHFEGRAPALFDNLLGAIILAPFFVWMEILFAFGYRPELKARVEKMVQEDVAKLNAGKAALSKGSTVNGKAVKKSD